MPDTLTGLSREIADFTRAAQRTGTADRFAAGDLAARVEEYREQVKPWELDEGTRLRLLVQLARTVEPATPADPDAALAVLGVAVED